MKEILKVFHQIRNQIKFHKQHPTCRLYENVDFNKNTIFGKYNVFFKNVILYNVKIGDYSYIQKNSSIFNCDIGNFCSIASGVRIGLANHPTKFVSTHPAFYSSTQPIPRTFSNKDFIDPLPLTRIGHDVWIGENVLVRAGITIGTGAVIGAGAVVTKDIAPYAIVAGVPAKLINTRFNQNIIERLLRSKWWEKTEDWLDESWPKFHDPEVLLTSMGL